MNTPLKLLPNLNHNLVYNTLRRSTHYQKSFVPETTLMGEIFTVALTTAILIPIGIILGYGLLKIQGDEE
jgi:PetM family of cytochrome b6f complex subunit 7